MAIGISSSYDEPGWSNIAEQRDGYNQAIKDITEHIQKMKSHYADGTICSMSESIIGENVCDDILNYLKEVVQKNDRVV